MKYVLSAKKWFVKTLTRIVNYESRVVKWNPDKANVKIHYFTTWFTNNSSTHIAQYLATIIQNATEIFFFKNYAENEAGSRGESRTAATKMERFVVLLNS